MKVTLSVFLVFFTFIILSFIRLQRIDMAMGRKVTNEIRHKLKQVLMGYQRGQLFHQHTSTIAKKEKIKALKSIGS